jgi:hypothetical protein
LLTPAISVGFFGIFPLGLSASAFIDWFFDVTNAKPAYCGGNSAWVFTGLDGLSLDPSSVINSIEVLALLLPKFVQSYISST